MINKDSLKARVNNISKELNINQNIVYNRFFYDAFLSRLAISPYKEKLVLKGGLYLSSLLGINSRATMDIDFYLSRVSMEKDRVTNIVKEICAINIEDNISFEMIGCSDIRKEDDYGGLQIVLLGRIDNIRYQFSIDVATGDPIVPSERNFKYKCLVTGEILSLKAYSLESVIAEKLETILFKGIANSRSKDFYDLYILKKTQFDNLNRDVLKVAYSKTCLYRNFLFQRMKQ